MLGNTSSITTTNNFIHAHVCCVFRPGEYEEPLVLDHHPSQTVINKHPPTATRHTIPYYFQFSFNWLSILSHLKWSTAARHLRTITKVPVFCSHCKIPGTRYQVQLSMSASSCYQVCLRSYLSDTEQIASPMYSFCNSITSRHYYTRRIMISFYYNGKISKEEDQSCYRNTFHCSDLALGPHFEATWSEHQLCCLAKTKSRRHWQCPGLLSCPG